MAGTAKQMGGFALKVGGFYDHVHPLLRIPAKISVSDFVGRLKASTSKHINETSHKITKFGWQDGFGAFTVSASQKNKVASYVADQMEHHAGESFEVEYVRLLEKHEVEYDDRHIWD